MAQGDLFDISAGGHGFHISSHLIAVLALFLAIFAMAGYVHFRSDSIPDRALKNKDHQGESVRVPISASPAAGAGARTDVFTVTQPANTQLISIFTRVLDQYTIATNTVADVQFRVGTTRSTGDIAASANSAAANTAVGSSAAGLTVSGTAACQTTVERQLFIQVTHNAGAVTTDLGEVLFMFDFYELPTAVATPL